MKIIIEKMEVGEVLKIQTKPTSSVFNGVDGSEVGPPIHEFVYPVSVLFTGTAKSKDLAEKIVQDKIQKVYDNLETMSCSVIHDCVRQDIETCEIPPGMRFDAGELTFSDERVYFSNSERAIVGFK